MARKIMLLSDSLKIRGEAVRYSIELARRMDSSLVFLTILPLEDEDKALAENDWAGNPEARVKEIITSRMEDANAAGVDFNAEIRIGDPSSELLKFLAGSGAFQTIVWGGEKNLVNKKAQKKKDHWLVRMKGMIECPIVVPSMKS